MTKETVPIFGRSFSQLTIERSFHLGIFLRISDLLGMGNFLWSHFVVYLHWSGSLGGQSATEVKMVFEYKEEKKK